MRGPSQAVVQQWRAANLQAALVLLSDPHLDEEALSTQWARMIVAKENPVDEPWGLVA